jgi:hypothetical protein
LSSTIARLAILVGHLHARSVVPHHAHGRSGHGHRPRRRGRRYGDRLPADRAHAGIIVSYVRCAANTITIGIFNATGGTIDQASGTWNFTVYRGSTMGLR